MTADELALLKASEDRIVALELTTGEQFFAEIVMVVDEPPTPDVFVLRCERNPDGTFEAMNTTGESFLLADIGRVARLPGVAY